MAYRLKYSDYSTTAEGPPDPAAWVGPPGPPGPPGPQGPPLAGGPFLPLSGGAVTGDVAVGGALSVTGVTTHTGAVRSSGTTALSLGTTTNGEVLRLNDVGATLAHHLDVAFSAGNNAWQVGPLGAATNLWVQAPGSGQVSLRANSATQLVTGTTASTTNYVSVTGSVSTNPIILGVAGSGTNIDISLTPKGTGGVRVNGPVGFNSNAPLAKPTISGLKGSNAALTSLLAALVSYGLITDSTGA